MDSEVKWRETGFQPYQTNPHTLNYRGRNTHNQSIPFALFKCRGVNYSLLYSHSLLVLVYVSPKRKKQQQHNEKKNKQKQHTKNSCLLWWHNVNFMNDFVFE